MNRAAPSGGDHRFPAQPGRPVNPHPSPAPTFTPRTFTPPAFTAPPPQSTWQTPAPAAPPRPPSRNARSARVRASRPKKRRIEPEVIIAGLVMIALALAVIVGLIAL
ncbi:hypothetical protein [Gordonia sp. ABSL49_1]|uniref:hypothetical protein n=1 Tax=Gordonia sp. ABSL49_1 TaxID=2920941 RepID=UPI001F0F18D5|nr:hypothetical protein [Gordonia sp. ABSL49_1]MCH5643824.1 hypothetical protein [Gordonia sp. ABSL49_1]